MGKDRESEAELSINSLSFHSFWPPRCQSKSYVLESHCINKTTLTTSSLLFSRVLRMSSHMGNTQVEISTPHVECLRVYPKKDKSL